jgi:F-type H+-transporting ATPase subunit b
MNAEIDWKILVGQIINFAILFFVLKYFLYKPFLSLLEKRRKKIEEGIKMSNEAEENLKKVSEVKRKMELKNEEDRKAILIRAEQDAKKRLEEAMKAAEEDRAGLLAKAEKEAAALKEKEKENTKKAIVDNAFNLVEKLVKESMDDSKNKKISEEFLSKLKI